MGVAGAMACRCAMGSGSLVGGVEASQMAQLVSSRGAASTLSPSPRPRGQPRLRGSGGGAAEGRSGSRGMPMGSGGLVGGVEASRAAQRRSGLGFHSSTPASSQDMRRWTPQSRDDVMVAPYEFYPWPRPTHGMPCVTLRLRNGAGTAATGRFRRDWVAPCRLVKFQKRAKSALPSPRGTWKASPMRPFENTKSDPATHPRWSSHEHGHQSG